MSLRAITHKFTEDRILTPTYAKKFQDEPPPDAEVPLEYCLWRFTTVNSKYGLRIVRRISKTAPHYWAPRLHE